MNNLAIKPTSEIIYKTQDSILELGVKIVDDTVWLNRQQMALLFDRDIKTIGKHINNALKEELQKFSVVANFATTANDGKIYQVQYYSLDVVLSVGYRVKSSRGIEFRIWANSIIKDYLLKGYAVNNRFDYLENRVAKLEVHQNELSSIIQHALPPKQGLFFENKVFDAYKFVNDLIKTAKNTIVLIDNYIDETVLTLLSSCKKEVSITIYTNTIPEKLKLDIEKFNTQYSNIRIKTFKKSHDRFLIIDHIVYHFGASLKDLGNKWFAFSKMEMIAELILERLTMNDER